MTEIEKEALERALTLCLRNEKGDWVEPVPQSGPLGTSLRTRLEHFFEEWRPLRGLKEWKATFWIPLYEIFGTEFFTRAFELPLREYIEGASTTGFSRLCQEKQPAIRQLLSRVKSEMIAPPRGGAPPSEGVKCSSLRILQEFESEISEHFPRKSALARLAAEVPLEPRDETPEEKAAREAEVARDRQRVQEIEKELKAYEAALEFPEDLATLRIYRHVSTGLQDLARNIPGIFSRGFPVGDPLHEHFFHHFVAVFDLLRDLRGAPRDSPLFRALDSALDGLLGHATRGDWGEFRDLLAHRGYRLGREPGGLIAFPSSEEAIQRLEQLVTMAEEKLAVREGLKPQAKIEERDPGGEGKPTARIAASAVLEELTLLFHRDRARRRPPLDSLLATAALATSRDIARCEDQDSAFHSALLELGNVLSQITSATSVYDHDDFTSHKVFELDPHYRKLQGAIRKLRDLEAGALQPEAPAVHGPEVEEKGGEKMGAGSRSGPPAGGKEADPLEKVEAVILGKVSEHVWVLGKKKPPLTAPQYNVVKALLDAGDAGLSKNELIEKSGHGGALKILKALMKDSDWQRVIKLAGKPGMRYRISGPSPNQGH